MKHQKILVIITFIFLIVGLGESLWGGPESAGKIKPSVNLTLEQAIDSIEAKLKSNNDLGLFTDAILKSNHSEKAIPTLKKLLLQGYRPYNRAKAAKALAIIWRRTKDERIAPILKQALKDSAEVVQIEILEGLNSMGEEVPMDMVERLARGEGKEKWIVDWGGPANPLEYMTEEQVKENKKIFSDQIQIRAISMLAGIQKERAKDALIEIESGVESDRVKNFVKEILDRFEAKKMKAAKKEIPQIPESEPERKAYHRAHLEEYLETIDSIMNDCHYRVKMEFLMIYIEDAGELSSLDKLIDCLLKSPCSYYRALAADAIASIEKANNDKKAVSALRKALDDSVTEVKFAAARALWELGEYEAAFKVISQIAMGIGKENWTADWYARESILNPETIEKLKRDLFQKKAIEILGKMGTEEAISVLQDIAQHNKEKWARNLASSILNDLKKEENR